MNALAPNILLVMADQLAPQFTGAYGHPLVKTPHMNALVQRGMRFDAAYCNSPLCAPSRFSMMTGKYISKIGAYDNATEFPSSLPTFAHYLNIMGYHTSLSGKMHFVGPDQLHGFQERVTTDIYPADYAWTPDWERADERIASWYHNMDSVKEAGLAATGFQHDYDDEVFFFAKRKLFDYAREQQQPFCLVASFMHPHDPYVARAEYWNLYDPAEIDMPKLGLADVEPDALSQRLLEGMEATKVSISAQEIRQARQAYYANTSYVDAMLGELIHTLKVTKQLDSTVIIVTADHGDMLGERGLWYKMNFFEHSARVPLIMAGPGIKQGTVPNACSLVDLFPTLLDIASSTGQVKPGLADATDGHSLWSLAQGKSDKHDVAIGEYCAEMTAYPVLMIRRGPYKYIHCASDAPMLFDLAQDPDEQHNLAKLPNFANLVQDFTEAVQKHWNDEVLRQKVIASQHQRRVIHASMEASLKTGHFLSWDYQPKRDASQEYVRNHIDWTEAASKQRFPPFEKSSKI
ncbi:MAG: choline-sulfatase [Deinococcales bacterium]